MAKELTITELVAGNPISEEILETFKEFAINGGRIYFEDIKEIIDNSHMSRNGLARARAYMNHGAIVNAQRGRDEETGQIYRQLAGEYLTAREYIVGKIKEINGGIGGNGKK